MTGLLFTKFYFPPAPAGFVARPMLLKRLDEALTHRLTLVSAPAGAGKTTLISAWVQSVRKKGQAFGWLSLDRADNNPGVFLEYLGACLEEGGSVIEMPLLTSAPGEAGQVEGVLAEFIRGLMDLKGDAVLILDDYHVIENKDVHAGVQYLLDHAPAALHLILLTRSDPPLETARLRVAGQLVEIRMEQLRFSAQEAGEFLDRSAGVHLNSTDVDLLNSRTEGWIAGLQMAAISLRGSEDSSGFVRAFAGSHRYVFDYLIEQVLDHQTAEMREFLLKTSILDRLSAPLCDATAGTNGAARGLLDTIERANLFLVPLDSEQGWYRYHHLFSELLQLMLEQIHPGLSVELHARASHWYETQGFLPEALDHALAAGDMERVANIVSKNVLALVEYAEITPILARMHAIPEEKRPPVPWLELATAWGLAYTGMNQRAEQVLSTAEQKMDGLSADQRRHACGHLAAVRAYLAWTDGSHSAEAIALAGQAAELLEGEDAAVRALNLTTLGNAMIQIADDPRGAEVLEQALRLAQQSDQSHVVMQAASGLAYIYVLLGKLNRAEEVCEEALQAAETYQKRHVRPLAAAASVLAALARVWLERGEFEKALNTARKAMALGRTWGQVDNLMMCAQYLVYALSFTNQSEAAREVLLETHKIARNGPPWHFLTIEYAEMQAFLDGDPQDGMEIRKKAEQMSDALTKVSALLRIRLLVKSNHPAEALPQLKQELAQTGRYSDYQKAWFIALMAMAHYQQKNMTAALDSLQRALELAEPEDMATTFLREGAAMEKLLRLAQARNISPAYIRRLLTAFEARRRQKPAVVPVPEELIERLSERELEVLGHLNSYLSIPEIADLLVLSINTVRTHIKSIYGKLGVHGRSGAVKRAKELGLLT